MSEGEEFTFKMAAEQTPDVIPGDVTLTLVVQQKRGGIFLRNGNNLRMTMQISLQEALVGFKRTVPHLDGHEVRRG
jgi:DnaJ-class molecular chaperone